MEENNYPNAWFVTIPWMVNGCNYGTLYLCEDDSFSHLMSSMRLFPSCRSATSAAMQIFGQNTGYSVDSKVAIKWWQYREKLGENRIE